MTRDESRIESHDGRRRDLVPWHYSVNRPRNHAVGDGPRGARQNHGLLGGAADSPL